MEKSRRTYLILGAVFFLGICGYVGMMIGSCEENGVFSFGAVVRNFGSAQLKLSETSILGGLVGILTGAGVGGYILLTNRNFMFGKEHGSSRWGSPSEVRMRLGVTKDMDSRQEQIVRHFLDHNLHADPFSFLGLEKHGELIFSRDNLLRAGEKTYLCLDERRALILRPEQIRKAASNAAGRLQHPVRIEFDYQQTFFLYNPNFIEIGEESGLSLASFFSQEQHPEHRSLSPDVRKQNLQRLVTIYRQPRRLLCEELTISMLDSRTDINNHILTIASPGSGKTHMFLRPNILQMSSSMMIVDPKKELLRTTGHYLKEKGEYKLAVLDLIDFELSDHYNPFVHMRTQEDIPELVDLIFRSREDPAAQKGDPVWDDSAKFLLESLCYLTMEEADPRKRTMRTVMDKMFSLISDKKKFDEKMRAKKMAAGGERNPAVRKYFEALSGAEETYQSVIFSLATKMSVFEDEKLLRILDSDDFDFENAAREKVAYFVCVREAEARYKFMLGLFYEQLHKALYYVGDTAPDCARRNGKIPVPFTFFLDEFRNTPLPVNVFSQYLSSERGRNISTIIIIQDLSQLKALFKEEYNTIVGDCDTILYLGSNEPDTNEWVSKILDDATIRKRSVGHSYGLHGSDSRNEDTLGRKLKTIGELRTMRKNEMILIIKGEQPIKGTKYKTHEHKEFKEALKLGSYVHSPVKDRRMIRERSRIEVRILDQSEKEEMLAFGFQPEILNRDAYFFQEMLRTKRNGEKAQEKEKELSPKALAEKILMDATGKEKYPKELVEICQKGIDRGLNPESIAELMKRITPASPNSFVQANVNHLLKNQAK